ncbi:hypothetical protein SORBI_3010G234300 [Sorghum bicolor]|uniref:Uncharacterized protein n=1 Tax=Sorghum bicolor TaxID=4558 RepID=A0A194YL40_SORBI|nr:hypothetical protein SORBI_3010G234300 [Sorghum bicolor]
MPSSSSLSPLSLLASCAARRRLACCSCSPCFSSSARRLPPRQLRPGRGHLQRSPPSSAPTSLGRPSPPLQLHLRHGGNQPPSPAALLWMKTLMSGR